MLETDKIGFKGVVGLMATLTDTPQLIRSLHAAMLRSSTARFSRPRPANAAEQSMRSRERSAGPRSGLSPNRVLRRPSDEIGVCVPGCQPADAASRAGRGEWSSFLSPQDLLPQRQGSPPLARGRIGMPVRLTPTRSCNRPEDPVLPALFLQRPNHTVSITATGVRLLKTKKIWAR